MFWVKNPKTSGRGSVFANNMRRASDLDSGGSIGMGYAGVWVLGPRNQVVREEGAWMQPKAETEPPGLGFGQRSAGGLCVV